MGIWGHGVIWGLGVIWVSGVIWGLGGHLGSWGSFGVIWGLGGHLGSWGSLGVLGVNWGLVGHLGSWGSFGVWCGHSLRFMWSFDLPLFDSSCGHSICRVSISWCKSVLMSCVNRALKQYSTGAEYRSIFTVEEPCSKLHVRCVIFRAFRVCGR